MTKHEVQKVLLDEELFFKGINVHFLGEHFYCSLADEIFDNEKMMASNDVAMKDAYRKEVGLLTSSEIVSIREKYGISQNDLCVLLGWGGKTITRYEGHQVQDSAHDTILRKLDKDPEWFLYLLKRMEAKLPSKQYDKYLQAGTMAFAQNYEYYLSTAHRAKRAKEILANETTSKGQILFGFVHGFWSQLKKDNFAHGFEQLNKESMTNAFEVVRVTGADWRNADEKSYTEKENTTLLSTRPISNQIQEAYAQ